MSSSCGLPAIFLELVLAIGGMVGQPEPSDTKNSGKVRMHTSAEIVFANDRPGALVQSGR
jgi:hypothetical protein